MMVSADAIAVMIIEDPKKDLSTTNSDSDTTLEPAASSVTPEEPKVSQKKDVYSEIHAMARSADLEGLLKVIKENPECVNDKHIDDVTPLHYAALLCHTDIMMALLNNNANPNVPTRAVGQTPLHYAAYSGNVVNIKLLLEAGANKNVANRNGATPLHLAACYGQSNAVESLLVGGATIDLVDNNGMTPLMLAAKNDHVESVKHLLRAGANKNLKDSRDRTIEELTTSPKAQEVLKKWEYRLVDIVGHFINTTRAIPKDIITSILPIDLWPRIVYLDDTNNTVQS